MHPQWCLQQRMGTGAVGGCAVVAPGLAPLPSSPRGF